MIQLAVHIVDLCYPFVELTLFDRYHNILEIKNSFSQLKEDQNWNFQETDSSHFAQSLLSGRHVRCLFWKLPDEEGFLRFRYDLTHFKNLQDQLNVLFPVAADAQSSWKQTIDRMISDYVIEKKVTLHALSPQQNRELILMLQSQGLLDFKESTSYIATKLQVSRATVYNYLKAANTIKKVHVHQVDAFTHEKFAGNPAGVVLDADQLDENIMRKIARELNLSETSFVLQGKRGDFQLRYFTPTGHEITFCGHSTVGALFMLAKEQRFEMGTKGLHQFHVDTLAGMLKMEIVLKDNEEIQVCYETPLIKLKPAKISHAQIAEAAGIDPKLLNVKLPVMYEQTNKDLFVAVRSLEDLKKVECQPKTLAQFCKGHDIVALCVLCPQAFDANNQFHMRCFAPLVGIPEDPFTGSVLGGLAAYVDQCGLLSKGAKSFHVEQGNFMNRPGVVKVEFAKRKNQYHAKVIAQAVHCFSTEINLT